MDFSGSLRISIHALLAESDEIIHVQDIFLRISIHALLAESDLLVIYTSKDEPQFLSTLSLRRATRQGLGGAAGPCISIHALLAESDAVDISASREASISIHALLAESDFAA